MDDILSGGDVNDRDESSTRHDARLSPPPPQRPRLAHTRAISEVHLMTDDLPSQQLVVNDFVLLS